MNENLLPIYTYIYIKEWNFLSFYARMKKKTVLESLKDFLQNIFSIFFFVFYWKRKKKNEPTFSPHLGGGGGGSSAASPLEIWDMMPPYLIEKTFWAKSRKFIILTIFAWMIPLN